MSGQNAVFGTSVSETEDDGLAANFIARRAQVRQRRAPRGAEGDGTSHFGLNSRHLYSEGAGKGEGGGRPMSVMRQP